MSATTYLINYEMSMSEHEIMLYIDNTWTVISYIFLENN